MKFLDLQLLAYGPFKDVRLDFSGRPLGLHVIYGRNEAGKSTTLRAVKGLLYGIDDKTVDAHTHRYADLRIGARLAGDDGSELAIVRRKGRKDTLLDPDGRVLDEVVLARLLHSVGPEQFGTMFGLDHVSLRRGGEALLQGGGEVGESLFEAGLGGGALHDVLRSLREEAEALWGQGAAKRPLNEALRQLSDAQKRLRDAALSSEAWSLQDEQLKSLKARQAELEGQLRELQLKQSRYRRARACLPLLARRRALAAERTALGEVVLLPERATADRERALQAIAEARVFLERLAAEIGELEDRRARLRVPEALVADEERLDRMRERLHVTRKAAEDLPKIKAERLRVSTDARALASRVGRPLDRAEEARLDVATQTAIRKLAQRQEPLERERARARRALDEATARLAHERGTLAALPEVPETAQLAALLQRAQRNGEWDLEERLRSVDGQRAQAVATAEERRATLGLALAAQAAARLPVPTAEAIVAHEQRLHAVERRVDKARDRLDEARHRREERAVEIDKLRRQTEVPTEDDLRRAREERDRAWTELTRSWEAERARGYEAQVALADELADRLRREATTVAQMQSLQAERDAAERAIGQRQEELSEAQAERAAALAAWEEAWRDSGVRVAGPAEMRGWLQRQLSLVDAVERLRACEREQAAIGARIAALCDELAQALERLGAEAGGSLIARLERAAALCERAEASRHARARLAATVETSAREQERAVREADAAARAVEEWREAWAGQVARIGLPPQASGDEAIAVLDVLAELFARLDEGATLDRRIASIQRDADAFAVEVARLCDDHAPELGERPPQEAAEVLLARYKEGRDDANRRENLDQQLADKSRAAQDHEARRMRAEVVVEELVRAARVTDAGGLLQAEARSQAARELDRRVRELEDQLLAAGEGADVAALEEELAGLDADEVASDLEELEREIDEAHQQKDRVNYDIGGAEQGIPLLRDATTARDAAADAQEALARARAHLDRWLRVRTAQVVLARQIERYREQNQGPILTRGSELFRRLTVGRYAALKAGFNERDQAVLRCVRADGQEVDVEGLSDGTRDQLYLALRLASLERYAARDEPLPLVVDDILIHFDDHRARAGLEVLSELTDRFQVLFFTHHARLVELARAAVPGERMCEHELPPS